MSALPIIQLHRGDFQGSTTSLRGPCERVVDFGAGFQRIVDDLIETLKHHTIAIGLAAPQVGIQLKLAVINLSPEKNEPTLVLVNPIITAATGKKDHKKEMCMSLPHYCGEVVRRQKLQLSFQNRNGQPETLEAQGFLARVIAHEVDHLEGMLYIDRMDSLATLEPVDLFRESEGGDRTGDPAV
jgi:peptide deformylase